SFRFHKSVDFTIDMNDALRRQSGQSTGIRVLIARVNECFRTSLPRTSHIQVIFVIPNVYATMLAWPHQRGHWTILVQSSDAICDFGEGVVVRDKSRCA